MEITTDMVKELRQRTGAGVLDSKRALQDTAGDMERAADLLREKGLARAARKSEREAKEGAVEVRLSGGGKRGVLVEVNCETDFVARTEDFRALVNQVVSQVENADPPYSTPADLPRSAQTQAAIVQLGENIQVRRFARYDISDDAALIETYAHMGGRVAVMVELAAQTRARAQSEEFKTLAHDLALQVAALKPVYVRPEDVPAGVLDAERSRIRLGLADEKKPANILERIVEGKLQKFYEETCLFNQAFIRDDKLKVGALVKQTAAQLGESVQVRRFARFELGE